MHKSSKKLKRIKGIQSRDVETAVTKFETHALITVQWDCVPAVVVAQ